MGRLSEFKKKWFGSPNKKKMVQLFEFLKMVWESESKRQNAVNAKLKNDPLVWKWKTPNIKSNSLSPKVFSIDMTHSQQFDYFINLKMCTHLQDLL